MASHSALHVLLLVLVRLRVSLEAIRGLFGFGLQSYQRLGAAEAKHQSVLSKCTQFLTQVGGREAAPPPSLPFLRYHPSLTHLLATSALLSQPSQAVKTSKDVNDQPSLHAVLRAILLILRILQEGNARCPAAPPQAQHARPGSRGAGGMMMMDFFTAPTHDSAAVSLPYQDEMKALGQAVIQAGTSALAAD